MAKKSQSTASQPIGNVAVDLGLPALVDFENLGYMPSHADVRLTRNARDAVKRLAVTLDQHDAKLSDGSLVKSSVPKTIVWLCERLADSV